MSKEYYLLLGVSADAAPDEIKAAYRRRALEFHPDQSAGRNDPFLELQEAYDVLSDPMRRAGYDRRASTMPTLHGERLFSYEATPMEPSQNRAEVRRALRPAGAFEEISLAESFATFHPSFEELFARLWSNFTTITRPKAETLQSLTVEVPLSPDQARSGGQLRIIVPARATCPSCDGRGSIGFYECWRCAGHGAITSEFPVTIAYPAGLVNDYVIQLPLENFGIRNFYLQVHLRPTWEANVGRDEVLIA